MDMALIHCRQESIFPMMMITIKLASKHEMALH